MGYGIYLNWSRRKFWLPFIPFLGAILLALPAFAAQKNLDQGQVRALIAELVAEHGFDSQALTETFSEVDRVERVVKAMARPAEKAKPWYEYRKHFISAARINSGVKFWQTHQAALTAAEAQYGVAPEVIVGIIGVETSYGAFTGKDRVLDALATLAFHYPESRSNKVARMKFFRSQLKDLMLLAREQSIDPLSLTGSYAGAMGIPQFMPESYRKYAVDFNGDQRADIWQDPVDAIGSVANYLLENGGWQRGAPVVLAANIGDANTKKIVSERVKLTQTVGHLRVNGVQVYGVDDSELGALFTLQGSQETEYWVALQNFYAIMKYNPRTKYAMAVYQLSRAIAQAKSRQH